jgi:hypothetical protein
VSDAPSHRAERLELLRLPKLFLEALQLFLGQAFLADVDGAADQMVGRAVRKTTRDLGPARKPQQAAVLAAEAHLGMDRVPVARARISHHAALEFGDVIGM